MSKQEGSNTMDQKEKLYTKLMRIRYNDKLFDIFSGEDHRKSFLEVRVKDGKESYYYPILKDYIALNNIYNKPFDGVLHAKKYSFKPKVIFATYIAGISLVLTSMVGADYLEYKLRNQEIAYEMPSKEESPQDEEFVKPVKVTDQSIPNEITVDPSFYYRNGSQIMIYNNEALTAFGFNEVSIEDVRNTLKLNEQIEEKFKKIMVEFLNRVEERLPGVDLRVLNNNWKGLRYQEDLKEEGLEGGNFDLEEDIIHLKEKYINPETQEIDEEALRKVVYHELTHTLNYGKLITVDPNTSEQIQLYKFFRRTNYGESFSEGINTILTDYLLADSVENYFERETHEFDSYQITTPICYQIMKVMKDYTFYDFINKDVIYFDKKIKEHGFQNTISVLDAYFTTIANGQEEQIEIVEANELEDLLETIVTTRINLEIANQSSNFEILSMLNENPLDPERKFEIAQNILSQRQDDMIQVMSEQQKNEGLSEEEQLIKGVSTFKICGEDQTQLLDLSPKMLIIYRTFQEETPQYRLAYYGVDQECHDCETEAIVEYDWQNQLDILKVLPQMDLIIQTKIIETEDFQKKAEQKFKEQDAYYKQLLEEQHQKEVARNKAKEELRPLIVNALSEGKGDLEICRMLIGTQKNIELAMIVFGELKADRSIWYREDFSSRMITVFKSTGEGVTDSLEGSSENTHFVYKTAENEYRLGKILTTEGVTILYDYLENCPIESPETIQEMTNLTEILPEIGQYTVCMNESFLSSSEFIELMNQRSINNNQVEEEQMSTTSNQK